MRSTSCTPTASPSPPPTAQVRTPVSPLPPPPPSSSLTLPNTAYIADPSYDPIWAALNARRAPVFLHGAMTPSAAPHPHPTLLGLPVVAVPNETFKAAAALVMARKGPFAPLSPPPPPPPPPPPSSSPTSPTPTPTPADPDPDTAPPRARIVLSHLGGSAPSLIPRLAGFSTHLAALVPASSSPSEPAPPSAEEVFGAFGRDGPFWWETAGAGHAVGLGALRGVFVESEGEGEGGEGEGEMRGERGRVLFGTDFPGTSLHPHCLTLTHSNGPANTFITPPALTLPTIEYFTTRLRAFYAHDADARALEGVMGGNASRLLGIDAEGAWWAERWGGVELDTEVEEEGGV